MTYATVCSGIEAPSVAWGPLGWNAQWFSEIEPFPSALLAHRYPNVPNLGDMTKIHENETFNHSTIDLLCGGTPCQSFSIAGLRKGLDDPRGNLMLTFLSLIDRKRPAWVVWENVPGVLSSWSDAEVSEEGDIWQTNDFDTFLGGLRELGYGVAWRVLDAQYYGVAQRRRRVFVVAYLGDWRPAAAVLFERDSLQGSVAPSRQTGKEVAATITAGAGRSRGAGIDPGLIRAQTRDVAPTLRAGGNSGGGDRPPGTDVDTIDSLQVVASRQVNFGEYVDDQTASTLKRRDGKSPTDLVSYHPEPVAYRTAGDGAIYECGSKTAALTTMTDPNANIVSVFDPNQITSPANRSQPTPELSHTLPASTNAPVAYSISFNDANGTRKDRPNGGCYVKETQVSTTLTRSTSDIHAIHSMAVRRLTPIECERLQGFPDRYTWLPTWNGWRVMDAEETPDSCRAKGMAVKQNPKTGKWRVKDVDGPRYKALGNSMAVPVIHWIGQRIQAVNDLLNRK